jgi:REP element-mobilizing transposase RayT
LITTNTYQRQRTFADFGLACHTARTLSAPATWPDAKLLAWVLMPDHLHMLVELGPKESLSLVVRRVKSLTSAAVRQIPDAPSRVWQPGFHDHAMRKSEDVKIAARYLVANPLRAGLATDIGAYPFWDAVWLIPPS